MYSLWMRCIISNSELLTSIVSNYQTALYNQLNMIHSLCSQVNYMKCKARYIVYTQCHQGKIQFHNSCIPTQLSNFCMEMSMQHNHFALNRFHQCMLNNLQLKIHTIYKVMSMIHNFHLYKTEPHYKSYRHCFLRHNLRSRVNNFEIQYIKHSLLGIIHNQLYLNNIQLCNVNNWQNLLSILNMLRYSFSKHCRLSRNMSKHMINMMYFLISYKLHKEIGMDYNYHHPKMMQLCSLCIMINLSMIYMVQNMQYINCSLGSNQWNKSYIKSQKVQHS